MPKHYPVCCSDCETSDEREAREAQEQAKEYGADLNAGNTTLDAKKTSMDSMNAPAFNSKSPDNSNPETVIETNKDFNRQTRTNLNPAYDIDRKDGDYGPYC